MPLSQHYGAIHPEAWADLQRSGITAETTRRCAIASKRPDELSACGIPGVSHALVFPYFAIDGSQTQFARWKLFYAGEMADKPKYWQPKGSDPGVYLPQLVKWDGIALDPTKPIILTEGEKKALAGAQIGMCCLGIAGVWSWRVRLHTGERLFIPTLDHFVWTSIG